MIIGIDHGFYAIKTRNCSFPAGITPFGDREPYTRQNVLTFGGWFFVCGSGRQPIQRDKTANDNYYLLTLAAIAKELKARGALRECSVTIAAGLPLTSYGRDMPQFHDYLMRNAGQPVDFSYEEESYRITIADVRLFPQGFTALTMQSDLLADEPSLLLMDIGGWTVDIMRIDNGGQAVDTCHSLEFGMIRCIDEVRERVRQDTGLCLTDTQVEQVLAGGPCSLDEHVRSLIRGEGRIYTERLLSAVMEAGFDYMMKYSMYKTFAAKYHTKVRKIRAKYRIGKDFGIRYETKLGWKTALFYNEGFRCQAEISTGEFDTLARSYFRSSPSSLIQKLKARKCEWCGAEDVDLEVHHVRRLKDLKGKAKWERAMIGRKRKTMVLCSACHDLLHAGKLD